MLVILMTATASCIQMQSNLGGREIGCLLSHLLAVDYLAFSCMNFARPANPRNIIVGGHDVHMLQLQRSRVRSSSGHTPAGFHQRDGSSHDSIGHTGFALTFKCAQRTARGLHPIRRPQPNRPRPRRCCICRGCRLDSSGRSTRDSCYYSRNVACGEKV